MVKLISIIALVVFAIIWMLIPSGSESGFIRDRISIVGSSTVYPFATVVAEEFGHQGNKTPVIETTGTGGGFKLFCSGIGAQYPDFSNASRAIKQSEIEQCAKNGIDEITGFKIGYDGVVLANSVESERYKLTKTQIFMALAKEVPVGGKLVANPYKTWRDIDKALPDAEIAVYGPPPTSGTRDAFVELVMEKACKDLPEFVAAYPDAKERAKICHLVREDGKYIDSGENDNLIIQKLNANHEALGIFGFSFLEENGEVVQGSIIGGFEPSFEHVSSGAYKVSRPLYIYAKNAHIGMVKGMEGFIQELVSDNAIGEDGYLMEKGLVPLGPEELTQIQAVGTAITKRNDQ